MATTVEDSSRKSDKCKCHCSKKKCKDSDFICIDDITKKRTQAVIVFKCHRRSCCVCQVSIRGTIANCDHHKHHSVDTPSPSDNIVSNDVRNGGNAPDVPDDQSSSRPSPPHPPKCKSTRGKILLVRQKKDDNVHSIRFVNGNPPSSFTKNILWAKSFGFTDACQLIDIDADICFKKEECLCFHHDEKLLLVYCSSPGHALIALSIETQSCSDHKD